LLQQPLHLHAIMAVCNEHSKPTADATTSCDTSDPANQA
jgi:hypothetical protein